MPYVSAHGATFTWGTFTFQITSLQVAANAGSEIDITSMSSEVVSDPANSNRKMIVPDYDTAMSARYGSDFSIEFYASPDLTATNYFDVVGSKRAFTFKLPSNELGTGVGLSIQKTAILTQMQLGATTGEYVKGSATFRVTGM
jgi:hypothetical protein